MKIEDILFWGFLLLALFLLILRLRGSPGSEPILGAIIAGMWITWSKIGKIESRLTGIESKLDLLWNEFSKKKKL